MLKREGWGSGGDCGRSVPEVTPWWWNTTFSFSPGLYFVSHFWQEMRTFTWVKTHISLQISNIPWTYWKQIWQETEWKERDLALEVKEVIRVDCCYQFFLQQLSHGNRITLDIVGMNCYVGSSLMLVKLFSGSRVAKLNNKKNAPKKLFRNVEALLFPFWVVSHLCYKFQGHMLNPQCSTCFWASQNKDSPNQTFPGHKLYPGSKSGTSGSSTDFFRSLGQL